MNDIKINSLFKEKNYLKILKNVVGLNLPYPLQPGMKDFLPKVCIVFMPDFS